MGPARFGLDPQPFTIVWDSELRLPFRQQQVSQEQVRVREAGIKSQGSLQLALRFVELADPSQGHRIVVVGGGVVRPQSKRNLEVVSHLGEISGSGKKSTQVAVRVGIVGLKPDGLSKGRFSARPRPSREPDYAEIVVRFGHIRIQFNSLLERANGLLLFA